jgi:hypothetical protein
LGNQGRNRPNKGPRHEGGGRGGGGGGGGGHRDRDGNRDPNYRPGNNGGPRPDDQPPEVFEVDASEIISQADLAATKSSMNLSVLKAKPIYELVKMAESMGVEGMARSRKQDIIFGILKAHSRNGENIYEDLGGVCVRLCPDPPVMVLRHDPQRGHHMLHADQVRQQNDVLTHWPPHPAIRNVPRFHPDRQVVRRVSGGPDPC